jgi:alpha/beta superfamily hydrolase
MPFIVGPEPATVTESVFFRTGPYLLHGELAYPEAGRAMGAVVFAGPHPLLGGNMRNNVVRRLGDGLAQQGFLTLRFDYRGVGRSQGPPIDVNKQLIQFWKTSHAPGEADFWQDVQAATDFAQQTVPGLPVTLIGYSFGCSLLPRVKPEKPPGALVLIAPTVTKHDFNSYDSVSSPLLVFASEDDFATDVQSLEKWFNTLTMPKQLIRQRCDNHFFRGHENWLLETISRFLDERERS